MNIEMLEKTDWIIFKYKAGSHSYGTNIETSDIDYRGIFITPLKERITIKNLIPEVGQEKPLDIKYYELEKFFNLAKGCNPNIVEFLFSPKDCIEYCDSRMQKIIDNRHLFISKRAYHTFSGYAYAQIKKAKGQNKWVNNPKPKERPEKESYCFYIPFNGGSSQFPGRPIPLPETNLDFSNYRVAKLEHVANIFRLYSFPNDGKVFDNGDIVCTSIPFEKEKDFAGFLIFNKEQFKIDKDDWESYWTWVKERNPNRWVAQEKKEADYDCYLEKETEFLTNHGWKKFDEVTDKDKLATLDKNHNLIYQKYTNKFDSLYSGKLYTYENRYTKFSITPNHKLYVSDCHRTRYTNFSTKYNDQKSNWRLESLENLVKSERSHWHILTNLENKNKDYNISDDYIKLMGLYISEGSICFDKKKKKTPSAIFISQLENGKITNTINSIDRKVYDIRITSHFRKNRNEFTYRIQDKILAKRFLREMGHGCKIKKLPNYVKSFSKRQIDILINSLVAGDGHRHSKGHIIYYTSSKELANQLHVLLSLNGYRTLLWGPYTYPNKKHSVIYQVHISKHTGTTSVFIKHNPRGNVKFKKYTSKCTYGLTKKIVKNTRIVCFEVPNSILITKNNNKIAIQGNSKNMLHTIRLLWSGENILRHGEPIVRFEGEQLKFLRDIRENKFSYEFLMEMVEEKMVVIEELSKTSKLSWEVDIDKIDKLFKELIKE